LTQEVSQPLLPVVALVRVFVCEICGIFPGKMNWGCAVSIMSDCGLDDRGLIPWQGLGGFWSPDRPWVRAASYSLDTGDVFFGYLTIHTCNLIT